MRRPDDCSKSLAENEKVRMADEIEQRVKNIVEKADKNEDGQVSIKGRYFLSRPFKQSYLDYLASTFQNSKT